MKKLLMLSISACVALSGAVSAQQTINKTTNKKATVVHAQTAADGSSQIAESMTEQCIVSLPAPKDLVAVSSVDSSAYLKEINGETGRDGHTKVYSAVVSISYLVRQKFILIITTSSIEKQEPVTQEQTREKMVTTSIRSDPNDGDIFAGRSRRKYYYSTPEAAENNAKKGAEAWLKQQQEAMCSAGAAAGTPVKK